MLFCHFNNRIGFLCFLLLLTTSVSLAIAGPFADIQTAASPIKKYMSAPIKACVRIDMAGDAASEGLSAVFPVSFSELKIVSEASKNSFGNYGLPPEGYEFVLKQGHWQLFNEDGVRAVSYKLTFPSFSAPIIKSLLRAANPGTFSDLELDKELKVLGITGWGIEGNDVSSLLRLPFKTAAEGQISSGKAILYMEECEPPNADAEKFLVSGGDLAMAQGYSSRGMWGLVYGFLEDKRDYQRELMKTIPNYQKAVDIFYEREICDRADTGSPIAKALGVNLRINKDLNIEIDLESVTRCSSTTTPVEFRLTCWPFMESSGFLTYNSFSEPGFGKHRGEMMVYLTPLSLQSERLAALALERELVRAIRTKWLIHGIGANAPVVATLKPDIADSLHESLLRMSRPLWENLAVNNAHQSLDGANTLGDIPKAVLIRMNNNMSETLQKVMRPERVGKSAIILDDHHLSSYPFPMRTNIDGWYSRAVYLSWQNWGDTVKTKTVDAVIDLLSSGFTRNTKDLAYKGYSYDNILAEFRTASKAYFYSGTSNPQSASMTSYTSFVAVDSADNKFQGKYHWDVLKSHFTDLEWLAQSLDPLTGSGHTINADNLKNTAMTPIILPFWHAKEAKPMLRLSNMVRGTGFGCAGNKVVAVEGLPWTTNEPSLFCYINDVDSINKLESICNAIISDPVGKSGSPTISSTTYEYVTTAGVTRDKWATTFTTTTDPTFRFEARRYYQDVAKKSVTAAIVKLRELAYKNSVGIVKSVIYGYSDKMRKFQTNWDSGSYSDLNVPLPTSVPNKVSTETAVVPTICRLFDTINDFIDKTRYIQQRNDGNAKSWQAKNELFIKLKRDVFIEPSLVPQHLWQRYLYWVFDINENGYNNFKSFMRRFTLAAHGLSAAGETPSGGIGPRRALRKIRFMKPGATSTAALTAIQP